MTAFSQVYDKFYELVETDSNFFQYFFLLGWLELNMDELYNTYFNEDIFI